MLKMSSEKLTCGQQSVNRPRPLTSVMLGIKFICCYVYMLRINKNINFVVKFVPFKKSFYMLKMSSEK